MASNLKLFLFDRCFLGMQQLGLLQGQGKAVGFNLKPFDSLKTRRRVTRLLELFVAAAGMYWGDCSFLPQRRGSTWSYLLPSSEHHWRALLA
jgi:hypothetical protein